MMPRGCTSGSLRVFGHWPEFSYTAGHAPFGARTSIEALPGLLRVEFQQLFKLAVAVFRHRDSNRGADADLHGTREDDGERPARTRRDVWLVHRRSQLYFVPPAPSRVSTQRGLGGRVRLFGERGVTAWYKSLRHGVSQQGR